MRENTDQNDSETDTYYAMELLKIFAMNFDTSLEVISSYIIRYFSFRGIKINDIFSYFTNSDRFEVKNMIALKQSHILLILGQDKNIPNILLGHLNFH